ncbi:MAG: methionine biosynthesis protein MetW [Opitutales bacterium]
MSRSNKRQTDFQIISNWIEDGSRVLDLGCGRGVLLEHLAQARNVRAVGVDTDLRKIQSCVRRGVSAYQGDAEGFLAAFPDGFFDWVIVSRTLQELDHPGRVMAEALRVGRTLAVGFVNHAYLRNRWAHFISGERVRNEVYPRSWHEDTPSHEVSVASFERFCAEAGYTIRQRAYLRGDWKTPLASWPNLRAGYAVYALTR